MSDPHGGDGDVAEQPQAPQERQDGAIAPPPLPLPGWYRDPWSSGHHRYWDGHAWTPDVFADVP